MGYSNRRILGRPTASARLIPASTAPFNKSAPWAPRAEARPPTPTGATPMLSTHDPMALPRLLVGDVGLRQCLVQRVHRHGTGAGCSQYDDEKAQGSGDGKTHQADAIGPGDQEHEQALAAEIPRICKQQEAEQSTGLPHRREITQAHRTQGQWTQSDYRFSFPVHR